jgi:hypothetical protein
MELTGGAWHSAGMTGHLVRVIKAGSTAERLFAVGELANGDAFAAVIKDQRLAQNDHVEMVRSVPDLELSQLGVGPEQVKDVTDA